MVSMYDRILVATDGSADANRAVTHALEQAEQHGAEAHEQKRTERSGHTTSHMN